MLFLLYTNVVVVVHQCCCYTPMLLLLFTNIVVVHQCCVGGQFEGDQGEPGATEAGLRLPRHLRHLQRQGTKTCSTVF